MTNRSIDQVFDNYLKARLCFAQSVADPALRPQNVEALQKNGVLDLLKPLLSDPCSQIRQTAAVGLGRLVDNDARLAEELINKNFIPVLLQSIHDGNKYQKKTALFVLRSMCKHDGFLANCVITAGGLQAFVACLEDFEPCVKEAAAWGIGYIARHSPTLAQACVESGAVPLLMLCLQEPELSLKQITTSAISDIAKHSLELAQNVTDSGVVPYLAKNLENTDEKLKRQVLTALSSCAKHSTELAEAVVEAEVFPSVLLLLGHPCPMVRRNAAILIRDIVKHSLELTQMVVNSGGIGALMETLNQDRDEDSCAKIPSITALGFIAGHSDQLAISVIGCKAIILLAQILDESKDEALLTVTAWCLGQIGKHSPEHSQAVAAANILPMLLNFYTSEDTGEDLKYKCKNALKLCLQKCLLVSALEPLLFEAPANILKYTLGQYSKVTGDSTEMRELAARICKDYLHGVWKKVTSQDIGFKHISGGLSNLLYHVSLPEALWKESSYKDEPREILIRIYGQTHGEGALEALITESVIFTLLSERGLGPKLHGIFPGGRIEQYINARPLLTRELADERLTVQIAQKMATIHSMEVPLHKEPTWMWDTINRWLQTCEKKLKSNVPESVQKFLEKIDLRAETEWLKKRIDAENTPVVFCHNDMQEGNILMCLDADKENNNAEPKIVIIDFEYCSYNYRAFDVANHFIEWMYDYTEPNYPFFSEDFSKYPTEKQRLTFIRAYLDERGSRENPKKLMREVELFTMASHFFWSLWGFINADTSKIPFGYWEYACSRLSCYQQLKQKATGSVQQKRKMDDVTV